MRKQGSILAVWLLLIGGSAYGQDTAVIGTWNLAGNNVADLTDALLREQARGIAEFEPDLLVLTEVDPATAINRLVELLRDEQSLDYEARIIDQPTNIDIGIIFKAGIQVSNTGLIEGSALGDDNLRRAFFADVRVNKFDFRVIGVHFKSSSGSSNVDKRRRQAVVVAEFIDNFVASGSERDVLLIGDYNMFPRRDGIVFDALSPNGFLRFISSEQLCTGPDLGTCLGTHIQRRSNGSIVVGNLLDGFAISTNHTGEYLEFLERVNLPQELGLSLADYRTGVSDHFPIVARFRTDEDDDGTVEGGGEEPAGASMLQCLCKCECLLEGSVVQTESECSGSGKAECSDRNGETCLGTGVLRNCERVWVEKGSK